MIRCAAATTDGLQNVIRPAVEVLIGRSFANAATVEWEHKEKQDRGDHLEMTRILNNTHHGDTANMKSPNHTK